MGQVVTYAITTLLAAISLIGGLTTNFFGLVEEGLVVPIASASTAIFLFIIGDRVAMVFRDKSFSSNMEKIIPKIISSSPDLYSVTEFLSSDKAMEYLCSQLRFAKVVLNTKISKDAIPPRRDVGDEYLAAVKAALKAGLVYKDVVSPGFKDYAEDLLKYQAKETGTYQYTLLDSNDPAFLNFIVLEYESSDEEVIIGWATSPYIGTEQKAYSIRDRRLISYFRQYHAALYQL